MAICTLSFLTTHNFKYQQDVASFVVNVILLEQLYRTLDQLRKNDKKGKRNVKNWEEDSSYHLYVMRIKTLLVIEWT